MSSYYYYYCYSSVIRIILYIFDCAILFATHKTIISCYASTYISRIKQTHRKFSVWETITVGNIYIYVIVSTAVQKRSYDFVLEGTFYVIRLMKIAPEQVSINIYFRNTIHSSVLFYYK